MHVIQAKNVNVALARGLEYLTKHGIANDSRNGPVLVAPAPVTTVYERPLERWVLSPTRDANPFFHVMEAIWMLAGRNDIQFPQSFNSRFGAYSDDGVTQRGAYGYRWRKWFGYDQLHAVVQELQRDPLSRRAVLTMWDGGVYSYPYMDSVLPGSTYPEGDLRAYTVDKPCNTHAYFSAQFGALNMTVCNRSNDVLWGAYGANAVHFSYLQEYIAARLDLPVGYYWQISNNYHLYTEVLGEQGMQNIIDECWDRRNLNLRPEPLVADTLHFDRDLYYFMEHHDERVDYYDNPFFKRVAQPMYRIWRERKTAEPEVIDSYLALITDDGWRLACTEWLARRKARTNVAN